MGAMPDAKLTMSPLSPVYTDPALQVLYEIVVYFIAIGVVLAGFFLVSIEALRAMKRARG